MDIRINSINQLLFNKDNINKKQISFKLHARNIQNAQDVFCSNISKENRSNLLQAFINGLKDILKEDEKQKQPLFYKIANGLIENIVDKTLKKDKTPFIIGVAGESASGKTTIANHIMLGNKEGVFTMIHQDDYFKDCTKELQKAGSFEELFKRGFSFDVPEAIDLNLIKQHLLKLKKGETITSPSYNFLSGISCPNGEVKRPAPIVITEGLHALNEKIRDVIDLKIYVDTPADVIKERWYQRAASRGKTSEVADFLFQNVNEMAQIHVRPTSESADIVINGMVEEGYLKSTMSRISDLIRKYVN